MEVFALMGAIDYEGDMLLGVYASEEEAINARNVYVRDRSFDPFDAYYVSRQVVGSPANSNVDRVYI